MQNAFEAHMASSQCMSVLVGCPSSLTQLPDGPCLIIDAESIQQEKLTSQECFFAHYPEISFDDLVLINKTVISEFDHQIIDWHTFSDKRFDGPSKLSELSEQFPNLRLIESRKIEGITLSTIFKNQKILSDPLSSFELILRQGDPLIALQSAKEWLARCTRISFRGLVTSSRSLESTEAFLGASGFCKSSVDSYVWIPELEMSSLHLSLIRCGLSALFNADIYRELYPETKEMKDVELINHWLSRPNFREIAEEIEKNIRNSSDRDGLLALFNANIYRKLYPETKDMADVELLDHWLSQPDFREIAEEIEKNIRNSSDRDGLLALFNANIYRKLYPETKDMADVELLDHWLSQPDFRFISKTMNDIIQRKAIQISELTDQDPALQLLQHVFPFDLYRSQRPDLSQFPNRELINHFWANGQHEGIDLSESNVQNILDDDKSSQVNLLTSRVNELEHLLSCANAQLSCMQKLIVGLRDSGVINGQD